MFGKEGNMFNHFYSQCNSLWVSAQRRNPFSDQTTIKGLLYWLEERSSSTLPPRLQRQMWGPGRDWDGQGRGQVQGTHSRENAFPEIFFKCLHVKSYFWIILCRNQDFALPSHITSATKEKHTPWPLTQDKSYRGQTGGTQQNLWTSEENLGSEQIKAFLLLTIGQVILSVLCTKKVEKSLSKSLYILCTLCCEFSHLRWPLYHLGSGFPDGKAKGELWMMRLICGSGEDVNQ